MVLEGQCFGITFGESDSPSPSASASCAASRSRNGFTSAPVMELSSPSRRASKRTSEPAPQPISRMASPRRGPIWSIKVRNIA
jgi:hypothetical protein